MIDFRYHIVSIVSIFIALAVGIVLGAGPLKEDIGNSLTKQVQDLRAAQSKNAEELARARSAARARDDFGASVLPTLVKDGLKDVRVAMITLPGADGTLTSTGADTLRAAGATITSTTAVQDRWTATDEATVTARTKAVTDAATKLGLDPRATSAATLPGRVLASVLTAASSGQESPDAAARTAALAQLVDGGFVTTDATAERTATAFVVITPRDVASADTQQSTLSAYAALLTGLDAGSSGVVAASDSSSLTPDTGAVTTLTSLRDSGAARTVSTVDDLDLPMGLVTLVRALAQQLDGGVGHYGLGAGAGAPFAPEPTG